MTDIVIIIVFNLLLYLIFYKIITGDWLPKKTAIIIIVIGLLLVPLAVLIEKLSSSFILNENTKIIVWATIEEILKLTPILILLNFINHKKFTFLEVLGIGIGFAFLETILYGQGELLNGSSIYLGLPTTLFSSFLIVTLRLLGALILHTLTVGLMGLTLIYAKNKRKLLILIVLPFSIYIHYLYNKNVMADENYFWILLATGVLFILMFSLYIFIKSKIENSSKIKTIILKIGKFILKYIILFILWFCLFGAIDSINFSGFPRYSPQEIEQTKILQNQSSKSSKTWQNEELTKRYIESLGYLSRIREINYEIDYTYTIIVEKMENNKKLTDEEEEFLKSKRTSLIKEMNSLVNKLDISEFQISTKKILEIQKDVIDYFENRKLPNNIKFDFDIFKQISNHIINTNKSIIRKLETNEELSQEEVNYLKDGKNEKIKELNKYIDRLDEYFYLNSPEIIKTGD